MPELYHIDCHPRECGDPVTIFLGPRIREDDRKEMDCHVGRPSRNDRKFLIFLLE